MQTDSSDIEDAYELYEDQIIDATNYWEWNTKRVIVWIINLNPDKYSKYKDPLQLNLRKQGINGTHLTILDKQDLHNFGITDFHDKNSIFEEIKLLTANVDEEETTKTYVLSLPREMLSAYILLSLTKKFRDDWVGYGCCGQFGIFLAYAVPFMVQIFVSFALMSEVKIQKMRIDTSKQQLMFNIVTLSILFIYIVTKIVGLFKSTWYYLGKLKSEFDRQCRHEKNKEDIEKKDKNGENMLLQDKIEESISDFTSIELKSIDQIGIDEDDAKWMTILFFRLQIICVLVLYIGLVMYAIDRINSKTHIVDK